jgi:hypothetical protein
MVRVFRSDAPDGVTEDGATTALGRDAGTRPHAAALSGAIENDPLDLKQNCGVAKCQAVNLVQ